MKKFIFILVLILSGKLLAQEPFYTSFDWQDIAAAELQSTSDYSSHVLDHDMVIEFYFEGEDLVEYFLEHLVIKLDSDEAIENYNKVYLPYSTRSEIVVNKARVINPDGSILELDDSKVLTSTDEQTGRKYKFFAFEGLSRGSVIDYFYVVKRRPVYTGNRLSFQMGIPKKKVNMEVFAPSNLEFAFKSYNGLPEMEAAESAAGKLHWKLYVEDIPAIEEEEFSAYGASKKAVVYKLERNNYNNSTGFASYKAIVKNLHPYYYEEIPEKQKKALRNLIDQMQLNPNAELDAKMRELERYVKTNIFLTEGASDKLSTIENILVDKVADEAGIIKLYAALLSELKVEHELVFTSDRQDQKFDKEFEAHNFLTDVLIYIPATKKFFSPGDTDSRYGFPPGYLTDNYGLFIKTVDLGGFKSGLGQIKYVDAVGAERTIDNMMIKVDFNEDLSANRIAMDRSMSGYYAMYIQPYLYLANPEAKESLLESFAKRLDENAEILEKSFVNEGPEFFGVEPLVVNIEFNSEACIERAGPKVLLKVGELISEQTQLYQEKLRTLDVENEFNRTYERTIEVVIPEGFQVTNLEDIVIDNAYEESGKEVISFRSSYELDGNILRIKADEYYRVNIMKKELFEEFRTVINSAADFNKVVLILEPAK